MKRFSVYALLLLLTICQIGCQRREATSVETHDFQAALLPSDGSLKLEFFRNAKLTEHIIVPGERISPANAILATHFDESGLGPWCIVNCHIDPSTSVIVAWNPETNAVYCSPGRAWGIISSNRGSALATIFRPHFGTPPEAPDTLYVNEVNMANLPAYNWKIEKSSAAGIEFKGFSDRNEPMSAKLTYSGKWRSPAAKTYDVFYLYYTLQMAVKHTNIRGVHDVYFIRNGKVVRRESCSDEIIVQDNILLMKNIGGGFAPWVEAPNSIEKEPPIKP